MHNRFGGCLDAISRFGSAQAWGTVATKPPNSVEAAAKAIMHVTGRRKTRMAKSSIHKPPTGLADGFGPGGIGPTSCGSCPHDDSPREPGSPAPLWQCPSGLGGDNRGDRRPRADG